MLSKFGKIKKDYFSKLMRVRNKNLIIIDPIKAISCSKTEMVYIISTEEENKRE
jgi:hypothetical protein